MGQAFLVRRGGTGLKLKAVSVLTAEELPDKAIVNTLAVISEIKAGYLYVQKDRPEEAETGDVWAENSWGDTIDLASPFAGLKTGIQSVEQYDGTAWSTVETYIFNGEGWVELYVPKVMLYERGTDNTDVTGGWSSKKDGNGVVTWGSAYLTLSYSGDNARYASVYTKNAIDLTDYRKLSAVVSNTSGTYSGAVGAIASPYTGTALSTGVGQMAAYVRTPTGLTEETVYEADISALSGSYYIQLIAGVFSGQFHEIYLS